MKAQLKTISLLRRISVQFLDNDQILSTLAKNFMQKRR